MAVDNRLNDRRATVCGTYIQYPGGVPSSTVACAVVGSYDDLKGFKGTRTVVNPLTIIHYTKEIPFLGGQQRDPVTNALIREYVGYPIGNYATNPPDPAAFYSAISNAQKNQFAWEILAKTNPSRPHVSVPTFLAELRDIPKLVKGYGDGIIRSVANGNLSWRFAIAPTIGDLRKMCNFAEAVNKRLRYLRKLRDGKTIRKRVPLGASADVVNGGRILIHSQGSTLYAKRTTTYNYTLWGSAEWKLKPDSALPSMSDAELKNFAKLLSAGITTHGALETAWALCPWSWFVDWFSSVGTLVSATNNAVGCTWGRIALMRQLEARHVYEFDPVGSSTWPTFTGWYDQRILRKERYVVAPTIPVPLPYLPVIDGGKLSILLSLAALRR